MKKNIFLIGFLLLFLLPLSSSGQESTLLHFMKQSPQSLHSNPANLTIDSTTRYYFGIPFFSNISIDLNSSFAYSDLFLRNMNTDSIFLNRDVINRLGDKSRIAEDVSYELLSFGIAFGKSNMITFSLSSKAFTSVGVPKDLAVLLFDGNIPGETLGVQTNVNGSAYVEAALGFSRRLNDNWTLGLRAKYLLGIANAYADNMQASIYTGTDNYGMTMSSDARVETSYVNWQEDPFRNYGAGFDLGLCYKTPIPGLEVSLSMIDWGWINWSTNRRTYTSHVNNGAYTFNGLTDLNGSFEAVLDTLSKVFNYKETTGGDSYVASLPGKIYAGLSYNLTPQDKFGFLFSTRALHNFERTTFGVMYSRQIGNWCTVAAGNNFMIDRLFNPSLAVLFEAGVCQWHLAVENLSNFYVKDVQSANIQIGMTINVHK